jgi:hypothetical protein
MSGSVGAFWCIGVSRLVNPMSPARLARIWWRKERRRCKLEAFYKGQFTIRRMLPSSSPGDGDIFGS